MCFLRTSHIMSILHCQHHINTACPPLRMPVFRSGKRLLPTSKQEIHERLRSIDGLDPELLLGLPHPRQIQSYRAQRLRCPSPCPQLLLVLKPLREDFRYPVPDLVLVSDPRCRRPQVHDAGLPTVLPSGPKLCQVL